MVFSKTARLVLGLIIGLIGFLVAGELHASKELVGAASALTALFAGQGIVPPTAADLPALSPTLRFVLTTAATAASFVVVYVHGIGNVTQGLIVGVIALAASVGILPVHGGGSDA